MSNDDSVPSMMGGDIEDPLVSDDPLIFQNDELLDPTHVPNLARIVGRKEELATIEHKVKPAVHGGTPRNAVILSKPGTGKTLCAKNVVGRARGFGEQNGHTFVATHLNCDDESTATRVGRAMLNSVANQLGVETDLPASGIAATRYYRATWDLLDDADVFVLILDEADLLGEDANVVLKRIADAKSQRNPCNMGVIAISNKLNFYQDLDLAVQSRFGINDTEIVFSPYDSSQLEAILRNREDAFYDDVLETGVIPLCAAFAAQEHGDARKAIDLLRSAGQRAERRSDDTVTEEDVRAVHELATTRREREMIRSSVPHAQIVLLALAKLTTSESEKQFSTRRIHHDYKEMCALHGTDPQTYSTVFDHLKGWASAGITESQHTGGGRENGSYREHRLLLDPDLIIPTVTNGLGDEGLKDER